MTLGTSVTTATTYSAIDEALLPACCTLLTVSAMSSKAQGVCPLTVPIVIETTVRGESWEAYSKCEAFLSVLKSPSVSFVLLSHYCGHVQDAEAEVGFHDGAIFVGCKGTSFPCHSHQKDSLYLNPHPTLAPKLPRNQFVFVRCCLNTVALLSEQPVIRKRAPLTSVLSLSITVFGAPRLSHPSYRE